MATGVLLDAFIVRSLLVPSLMALLGKLELVVARGCSVRAGCAARVARRRGQAGASGARTIPELSS